MKTIRELESLWIALGAVLVFIGAGLIGYGVSGYMFSIAPQENSERVQNTVMAVCNYSVSTNHYDPCRIAEASSNMTYACNKNTCWTQKNN